MPPLRRSLQHGCPDDRVNVGASRGYTNGYRGARDDQWMWWMRQPSACRFRTMVSVVSRSTARPLNRPVVRPSLVIQAMSPSAYPDLRATAASDAAAKAASDPR